MNEHDDGPRRPPPAFMEYAGDILAKEGIRTMTMAERGLLATMRWVCWVNDDLPADCRQLARVLGVDLRTLRANLTPRVCAFFAPKQHDESRLICPELSDQKARLIARRQRLSEAGKEGREMQLRAQATPQGSPRATPQATPRALRGPSEMKRTEPIGRPLTVKQLEEDEGELQDYRRAFGETP